SGPHVPDLTGARRADRGGQPVPGGAGGFKRSSAPAPGWLIGGLVTRTRARDGRASRSGPAPRRARRIAVSRRAAPARDRACPGAVAAPADVRRAGGRALASRAPG